MVATRKSVNLHSTSYSQMPAQEMWQREAEEASEEEAEEEASEFQPLTMEDGGHLRLQLDSPSEEEDAYPNMPPLLNQRDDDTDDEDEDSVKIIAERDPIYRATTNIDNPSQLLPSDDFDGPPNDFPSPPPSTPSPVKPSFLQQSQRSHDAAGLLLQLGGGNKAPTNAAAPRIVNPYARKNPPKPVEQPVERTNESFVWPTNPWSQEHQALQYSQTTRTFQAAPSGSFGFTRRSAPPNPMPAPRIRVEGSARNANQRGWPQGQQQPRAEQQQPSTASSIPLEDVEDNEKLRRALADCLHNHGLEGLEEDEKELADNCKEGKNSATYMDGQDTLEERWFSTIETYGGDNLQHLLDIVPANYDPSGRTMDRRFYNIVGGHKDEDKRQILEKLYILVTFKWKKKSGKKGTIGENYQPSTFEKYMQQLGYVFARKGILYDYEKDFDRKGGFAGIVKSIWKQERLKDRSFGVNPNRKRVTSDLLRLINVALKDGVLKPYEDPQHLLTCIIFINGFFCGLRGDKEHTDLMMGDVIDGVFSAADGPELSGLEYYGLKIPFSKMKQLKLGGSKMTNEEEFMLMFVEDLGALLDPVKLYKFYLDHCHPDALKFYCAPASLKNRKEWSKKYGRDIWFGPATPGGYGPKKSVVHNVGHNTITSKCQWLAKICGVEDWKNCTGHALRALMITINISAGMSAETVARAARHSSITAQSTYNVEDRQQLANRMNNGCLLAKKKHNEQKEPAKQVLPPVVTKIPEKTAAPLLPIEVPDVPPVASLPPMDSSISVSSDSVFSPLTAEIKTLEKRKRIAELRSQLATMEQPNLRPRLEYHPLPHYPPPPPPRYPPQEYREPFYAPGNVRGPSYGDFRHGPPPTMMNPSPRFTPGRGHQNPYYNRAPSAPPGYNDRYTPPQQHRHGYPPRDGWNGGYNHHG